MEIHQFKYFVAVAETGGFSKAAKRCYVTQPSLSQQIIKLEQELGHELFERLGRRVILTEAGKALLPRARNILRETTYIKTGMMSEMDSCAGVLSVGFIPTIAPYLLPGTLKRCALQLPEAEIVVNENLTSNLLQSLTTLDIDLAILSLPLDSKLINTEKLFDDPLVLAVSRDHRLASKKSVNIGDLRRIPFIALDEEHCLGEQIKNFCYERQVSPQILCRTWNLSTIQHCVSYGNGIALVPRMMVLTDSSNECVYRNIRGQAPSRAIAAAWHKERKLSGLAREFISILMDEHKNLAAHGDNPRGRGWRR